MIINFLKEKINDIKNDLKYLERIKSTIAILEGFIQGFDDNIVKKKQLV